MKENNRELQYFKIEHAYGGSQEWFSDYMMKIGGCAAVIACDSCIFFDLNDGSHLYPYDIKKLTRKDYLRFGMIMKPYLRPRWSGIDTLELYMEGFGKYLSDHSDGEIRMKAFSGGEPVEKAKQTIIRQIDAGFPIPCLILKHQNQKYHDFEWHWFLLIGYESREKGCKVKAVSYGMCYWFDLDSLWNTGYSRKGGLILYSR